MENEFDEIVEEEDEKPDEDPKPKEEPASVETLQSQIEELRKESDGRLSALRSERQERQELKGKVDAVIGMVEQAKTVKQKPEKPTTIPVSENEDGDLFVDPALVTADLREKIERLEASLQVSQGAQTQQTARQGEVNAVVSEDPAYKPAYESLSNAYVFIDKQLGEHVLKQGIDPKSLSGIDEALDLLEGSESFKKEFAKRYPGIALDLVVEAFTPTPAGQVNKRKLTQALKKLKPSEQEEKGLGKTLKFLTKKPSNLSSVRNQRGSAESSLDNIAGMDMDDFLSMSDQQVGELERILRDEELQG